MKISKPLIAAIIILALLAGVAAVYVMTSPNSDQVVVNNPTPTPSPTTTPTQATLSKVTISSSSIYVGSDLTLSTTVSDHTAGIVVSFKIVGSGTEVGTAVTDSNGAASLTITANTVGTYSFYATASHP